MELQNPQTANRLSGTAMLDAIDNNADMMVTPCPLCHLRMDVQQHNISKAVGREVDIPILHLPQMVGMALGEEKDLNVKFPEEYQAENLKGKDAVFKVKLHEMKVTELPELTDGFSLNVIISPSDSLKSEFEFE